jgi:hypothetical protein
LIGSIRRECVDHVIALGEAHLRGILRAYARYYNDLRTHRSLDKDAPFSRPVQRIGHITSHALSADSIIATCESEFSVHTTLPNPPNPHRTNRPGGARLVLSPPAVQPLTRKPGPFPKLASRRLPAVNDKSSHPAQPKPIMDKPLLSETDAQVSDRERLKLRRHFSQERRDLLFQ